MEALFLLVGAVLLLIIGAITVGWIVAGLIIRAVVGVVRQVREETHH